MIKPHGSKELMPKIVNTDEEKESLLKAAESMKKLKVTSAAAANLVMLGAGYFTPLDGFMNKDDLLSVANDMCLKSGLFWPTPVVNISDQEINFEEGEEIALIDPNVDGEKILAIQKIDKIEKLEQNEIDDIVEKVYGTKDQSHPGVKTFYDQGKTLLKWKCKSIKF